MFDPVSDNNIVRSCILELGAQDSKTFSSIGSFTGAGIYSIYYTGDFRLYEYLDNSVPIYVGKAVPPGTRTGKNDASSEALFKRLMEHKKSLECVSNLKIHHFHVRYLEVKDTWIPMIESALIKHYTPIWNSIISGFGNHNPGSGRIDGKKSWWDVIHPGRPWANGLANPSQDEINKFICDTRYEIANKQW